jgi:hypothetical protein
MWVSYLSHVCYQTKIVIEFQFEAVLGKTRRTEF